MENRRAADLILAIGINPITPADFIREAHAQAMDKILVRKPPAPLVIPITRSPDLDVLPRGPIEEVPYSKPPARRTHRGYQDPDENNNEQANRAAADRAARAKKKATARMKKMARRRG